MYKVYSIIIYLIKKINNSAAVPTSCRQVRFLLIVYTPTPTTHWILLHQDPLCCPIPSTESPPLGQPSPTTSADYVGTNANHTNWKNSRLQRRRCKLQAQAQAIAVGRKDG